MSTEFPKYVYFTDGSNVVLKSQEEQDAEQREWFNTPWEADAARGEEAVDKTELLLKAKAAGIIADGRWSIARLQQAISSAVQAVETKAEAVVTEVKDEFQ